MLLPDLSAVSLLPVQIGRYLLEYGHDVVWATGPRRDAIGDRPEGAEVVELDENSWTTQIKKYILQVDLVHIHTWCRYTAKTIWFSRKKNVPIILHYYGTDVWAHPRRPWYGRWRPSCWFGMLAEKTIFYSHALRDAAREKKIKQHDEVVVYPPVQLEFFPVPLKIKDALRKRFNYCSNDNVLMSVKGFHQVSGAEIFAKAFVELAKKDRHLRWHVCGAGDPEEVKRILKTGGCDDRVVIEGLLKPSELADRYRLADVVVLSTRLESYGNVTVESLSCGTPVMASPTVGSMELSEKLEGVHCLLGNEVDDWIECFSRCQIKIPVVTKKDFEYLKSLTLENVGKNFLNIYQQVLQ